MVTLPDSYTVRFDVKLSAASYSSGILHLTATNTQSLAAGSRLPIVETGSSGQLTASFLGSDESWRELTLEANTMPVGEWVSVFITVGVAQTMVMTVSTSTATFAPLSGSFSTPYQSMYIVYVYASNPWDAPAAGSIRNLVMAPLSF